MNDFVEYIFYLLRNAIPPAAVGLGVGAVMTILLAAKYHRDGQRAPKGQTEAVLLLPCYLGGLAALTFMDRMDGLRMGVQLYPFLAFREAWNSFTLQVWLNPLLNIAMFLPLGVLLPLAARSFRRWGRMLTAGAGVSLAIEALQYVLGRGQADVDDLICNVLGAMIGYCLCMVAVSLAGKRRRSAAGYCALPLLSAAALAGVFLAYYFQPYGNLADGPIYAADTKETEWVLECSLPDGAGQSGVYWAEPFTVDDCDAFAAEFLGRQGAKLDNADIQYYDNTAIYSDHITYGLQIDYKDRSYKYTDYRVDSSLRYSGRGGEISEEELRAALEGLGIEIPDAAEFVVVDAERGEYAFRAEGVTADGELTDGELTCEVAEGGILYEVDNRLSVSSLRGSAEVISPEEAYERLRDGRFSWRDVPTFNRLSPREVRVTDCGLEYMTDSKGFRQPVYTFALSDENDGEARGGNGWTTFVPALK